MKAKNEINGVRILKHGVKFAGKYHPCWYSHGKLIDGREAITVYAKGYAPLPKELGEAENNSDIMTDYFESDRIRFFAGSLEFALLKTFAH